MIVLDASVIVELFLQTAHANPIRARLVDANESLHAPAVLDLEVANALRRLTSRQEISLHRSSRSIALLQRFPITRYHHDFLLRRVWDLRNNLTAYDAAYVALAEALDATLLTRDSRLARSGGHQANVEVI